MMLSLATTGTNVAVTIFFVAVYGGRLLYQAYLLRHREKPQVKGDWAEILLVIIPKNAFVLFTIYFLLVGVPFTWISIVGWMLFLSGIAMRLSALRELGTMYSVNVEIRREHKLITSGVYGLVRHPLYLAYILDTTGMVMIVQKWIFLVVPMMVVLGWAIRIKNEEEALKKAFGHEYDDYARRVPSLNILEGIRRRLSSHHLQQADSKPRK